MPIIETLGLGKDFGGEPLFVDTAFAIHPATKIGLVGRNGSGKTTLLRILAGLDDDFTGSLRYAPGANVAYVPQKDPVFEPGETVVEFLCRDIRERRARLETLAEAMDTTDQARAGLAMTEYGRLRERYDALGGDGAEEAAARLLDRMGLGDRSEVLAEVLSGGEKNTVSLARAMMQRPDLLILDEPGNHLDMSGLSWLEDFLSGLPCAVLLVSHDRRMLDRVVESILELEGRKVTAYAGNYSSYRLEKLRGAAGQGQRWQADRVKVERLEELVRKFEQIARARPDPAWGKRLRAQRSRLARAKADATLRPDIGSRDAKVNFQGEASKADLAMAVTGYSKSFGEKRLFSESSFTVLNGERVALVGPNGSGKTSFLRDLMRTGSWDDPVIRVGPSMRLGYCAQDQSVFDPAKTVEEAFLDMMPTRKDVLAHLGAFLFSWEDLDKRCGELSGGELNRLQLARASALKANFLVLDEPTNHLDIPTREAVEDALEDFEGTVLAVSHDRYFLEKVAERVVFVEDLRFIEYEGSFAEYWRDVGSRNAKRGGGSSAAGRNRASLEDRGRSRRATAGSATDPAKDGLDLELKIASLERRREELERLIADAIDDRKFAESKQMAKDLERTDALLEGLWKQFAS